MNRIDIPTANVCEQTEDEAHAETQPLIETPPFPITWSRIGQIDCRSVEYLVDSIIPRQGIGIIFGKSGSHKTFIALDLALSVATGKDFHGLEAQKGTVLFVNGEGYQGIRPRCEAWSKEYTKTIENIDLICSDQPYDFLSDKNGAKFIENVKELKPKLVIIDTLARNSGELDENSNTDMGRFIRNLTTIQRELNCTVLVIHHSGHEAKGRPRGASSLQAAMDVAFQATFSGSSVKLECKKMKDAAPKKPISFVTKSVELSDGDDGMNSIVLKLASDNSQTQSTNTQNSVTDAIVSCIEADGFQLGDAKLSISKSDIVQKVVEARRIADSSAQKYIRDFVRTSDQIQAEDDKLIIPVENIGALLPTLSESKRSEILGSAEVSNSETSADSAETIDDFSDWLNDV